MRLHTTLVLLLLVGALLGALYFTAEKPKVNETVQSAALDGRSLREMKRVRWQFVDRPAVEVELGADGSFQIKEPLVDRAAPAFLQQIVAAWDSATLIATEYKDDAAGRHETGLEKPELTFAVTWPDGQAIAYDVGAPGPLGDDRFLRRDGKIWRGGKGLYESMRVGLDELRDPLVFRHRENLCAELAVDFQAPTGAKERLRLQRDAKGGWRLIEPIAGRTDTVAAVRYVTAVLSLRASTFLPGFVRRPERAPEVVIAAKGGLGEEKLELWLEQGTPYGQLPGRMGWFQCEPREFQFVFETQAAALRATALVPFENVAENLAEVVVDPGQGRGDLIHLVRSDNTAPWRLEQPVAYAVHPSRRNELVTAINNLRALEFVDDKKLDDPALGLGPGRLAVAVRGFADQKATTLWLGADVARNELDCTYACIAGEPGSLVLVPRGAADELRRPWTTYCALDVLKITVPVEQLVVDAGKDGKVVVFHPDADGKHWVRDGREGTCDDVREFVNDELREFAGKTAIDLRANKFGDPDHVVHFRRGTGDELTTLKVWDRGDAGLVVQPGTGQDVGFDPGARIAKGLRELWQ